MYVDILENKAQKRLTIIALLFCVFGFSAIAMADSLSKLLQQDINFLQVIVLRHVLQIVAMGVLWKFYFAKRHTFVFPPFFSMQSGRNLLMIIAAPLYMWSLNHVQVGVAISLMNTAPLFAVPLAMLLLGERASVLHFMGLITGMIGVVMIIQPGFAGFHPAMLACVAAAFVVALYTVLSRKLAHNIHPVNYLIYQSLVQMAIFLLPALFVWQSMNIDQWELLIGIAALATAFHLILLSVVRILEAHTVSSLMYTEVASGLLYGILLFGDFPNTLAIGGIFLITTSGIAVGLSKVRKHYKESHAQYKA